MIAIIGAMEEETTALKEQMEDPVITKRAGRTFYRGKLKGADTVVVTAGVGKVNAASCTQQVIDLVRDAAFAADRRYRDRGQRGAARCGHNGFR